jgi:deoxyribose-phosphate aldolase
MAALIDHTSLKPEVTGAHIETLCREAIEHGFGAVCVNGQWVQSASRQVQGRGVKVVGVAGFPLGASGQAAKVSETRLAVAAGADEIDVVAALGWMRSGRWESWRDEIAAVVEAAEGRLVKVILETAALSGEEMRRGCEVAIASGGRMVKTSTGFHPAGGASPDAVRELRLAVGDRAGVKASGGIRTLAMALELLRSGADRIGSSSAAEWGLGPESPTLGELLS